MRESLDWIYSIEYGLGLICGVSIVLTGLNIPIGNLTEFGWMLFHASSYGFGAVIVWMAITRVTFGKHPWGPPDGGSAMER